MDEEVVEAIKKIRTKLIIVEGRRDKAALAKLGCQRVVTLEHKALYEVVEAVGEKEIVLMTDLDREGRKLYACLKDAFSKRGIRVDDKLRLILFRLKISHIESLDKHLA